MTTAGDRLVAALAADDRPWTALLATCWAALAVTLALPSTRVNHDLALLLEVGRQVVEGGRPYVDYLETNPPYVHVLHAVPAALAAWSGWPSGGAAHALLAAAVGACALGVRALLRRGGVDPLAAGLVGVSVVAHAWLVLLAGDFGQKEHVVFLATLPWVVSVALGAAPAPVRFGLGVVAALGVQIKPHYVAAALVWLGLVAVSRRDRARDLVPDAAGFVVGGFAYPALWLALPAASREAMFAWYLPFVARGYRVYDSPWRDVFGISSLPFAVYAAAAWSARGTDRRLYGPLAGWLALGIAAYLAQHKGFSYHRVPLAGTAGVLGALGVARWHLPDRPLALSAFGLLLAGAAAMVSRGATAPPAADPLFDAIDAHAAPGDRILWLDTQVPPAWPGMLDRRYRPAARYLPGGFPIAMLYADATGPSYRSRAEATADELRVLTELGEDVARWRPPVAVIAHHGSCKACPDGFDVLDYLRHVGFLDRELAGYRLVTTVDGHAIFVPAAAEPG